MKTRVLKLLVIVMVIGSLLYGYNKMVVIELIVRGNQDPFSLPKMRMDSKITTIYLNTSLNNTILKSDVTNRPLSWDIKNKNKLTSVSNTRVRLLTPKSQLVVGNYATFSITTFDSSNKQRSRGGDAWFAVLHNRQKTFTTAGSITDYNNSTYAVEFYLGFEGDMTVDLRLFNTGEAFDWILQVVQPTTFFFWWGYFGNNVKSKCYIRRGEPLPGHCEFGRGPKGMGDTVLTCENPSKFDCNKLSSITADERSISVNKPINNLVRKYGTAYLFTSPFYLTRVVTTNIKVTVLKRTLTETVDQESVLKPCSTGVGISTHTHASGYWKLGKWNSLECKTKTWSKAELHESLRGYDLQLIGDSTLRQWYLFLNVRLGRTLVVDKTKKYYDQEYPSFDITFHFQKLPLLMSGSPTPIDNIVNFEPELIDGLTCHSKHKYARLLMLSHCAHFKVWTEPTFRDRMFYIKEAIVRLINRCSDVKVIIKGCNPTQQELQFRVPSNYRLAWYRNQILREIYQDVGVYFVEVWDLSISYRTGYLLHMPEEAVNGMIDLAMSHVFPLRGH